MDKYYSILGIGAGATEQEIKQAYRDLVKVWHPDRFGNDIRVQRKAEEKLKEINIAYEHVIAQLHDSSNQHFRQSTNSQNESTFRTAHKHSSSTTPSSSKQNRKAEKGSHLQEYWGWYFILGWGLFFYLTRNK